MSRIKIKLTSRQDTYHWLSRLPFNTPLSSHRCTASFFRNKRINFAIGQVYRRLERREARGLYARIIQPQSRPDNVRSQHGQVYGKQRLHGGGPRRIQPRRFRLRFRYARSGSACSIPVISTTFSTTGSGWIRFDGANSITTSFCGFR